MDIPSDIASSSYPAVKGCFAVSWWGSRNVSLDRNLPEKAASLTKSVKPMLAVCKIGFNIVCILETPCEELLNGN